MESSSAPSMTDQSRKLRGSHLSKICCKLPPLRVTAATSKNVALRRLPVGGASSSCMLNNASRKAEVLRGQPSSSFCVSSCGTPLRADRAKCGSKDASHQQGLSQLQTPKISCQEQYHGSNTLNLKGGIKSDAKANILPALGDVVSAEKRPRTVEEALQYFSDVTEYDQSNWWSSPGRTAQKNVIDTLEPSAVVDEEGGLSKTMETTETALVSDVHTQKVNFPSVRNAAPPFVTGVSTRQCTTVGYDTISESEEKGALENPLSVELISNLTDDELHAETQVLVARSMKLTTIDTQKGACDWKSFTSLSVLSLSHNCLIDISPLSVLAPTLLDINVNFNSLNDLSPLFHCKRLRHLSAAHNHINTIAGIGCCEEIETLILFHNCLHGEFARFLEHVSRLPKLRELDIDENPLLTSGGSGDDSGRGATSSTSETCTGKSECESTNRPRQSPSSLSENPVLLRRLLAKCPSLHILGGTVVQRLGSSAPIDADPLVHPVPPGTAVKETVTQDKTWTPQAPANVSERPKSILPVTERTTWTHKPEQSSACKCDDATSPHNNSQMESDDSSSVEYQEKEEGWNEVECGSGEPDDTASLEKLKKHVRMLRRENRNMYALLEENEELRRHVQYNHYYSNAVSGSAFAARTRSARPLNTLNRRSLCSASIRPRTALFLKGHQTTTGGRRCSPVGKRSIECGPLCDITPDVSKKTVQSSDSSNSASHEDCGPTERGEKLPSKSQSELQTTPGDECKQQSSDYDSLVDDNLENQQITEVLKWENDLLKQRLDRMVKYVQLLREDLDQARFSRIQGEEAGAKAFQSAEGFRPPETESTSYPRPVNVPHDRVEVQSDGTGRHRNAEYLEQRMSSIETPTKNLYGSKHDSLATNESDLEDSPRTSSSTSEILEDPQSSTVKSVVIEGELGQRQSGVTPSYACHSGESLAPQQTSSRSQVASCVGTCSNSGGGAGGAVSPAYEATRSGDRSRLQLTLRRKDKDVTDLLDRNAEDRNALRRESRHTEWTLSRSTSACSSVTQATSNAAAPLSIPCEYAPFTPPRRELFVRRKEPAAGADGNDGLRISDIARQGEKRSGDTTSRVVASKTVTPPIARHCRSQESLPSARRVCLGSNLPSALGAKDQKKESRGGEEMKPISKQASVKCRPRNDHQQHARESATNANATTGASLLHYNGSSFTTPHQKPLSKIAREEGTARQRTRQAAEASLLPTTLTENSTLTITRSRDYKPGGRGLHAPESSRQLLTKSVLPPLPRKTSHLKGSLA